MVDGTERRAVEWIKSLSQCAMRLRTINEDLSTLEYLGQPGALNYSKMVTKIHGVDSDKIGRIVDEREQLRGELLEEKETLDTALSIGKQAILDAYKASGRQNVKALQYVMALVLGATPKQAQTVTDTKRTTAYHYLSIIARQLAEAYPQKFASDHMPYGYYEFARGLSGAKLRKD